MTAWCQRVILGSLGQKRQQTPCCMEPRYLKDPTTAIKNEKGKSSSSTHKAKLSIRETEKITFSFPLSPLLRK